MHSAIQSAVNLPLLWGSMIAQWWFWLYCRWLVSSPCFCCILDKLNIASDLLKLLLGISDTRFAAQHAILPMHATTLMTWCACVQEMVLSKALRRKLALHITGANERKQSVAEASSHVSMPGSRDAAVATSNGNSVKSETTEQASATENASDVPISDVSDATAITSNGNVGKPASDEEVKIIHDIWAFKRSQSLFPSIKW